MPLDTFYLPKESISYVNFPILREQQGNIETIMVYALRVHSAVTDYDENGADKIDLNTEELQRHIDLCRTCCEALGTTESVPFDALIEVRGIMGEFLNLWYLWQTFGNTLFGTPLSKSGEEGSGL